jgi:hypothetical protein
VTINSINLNKTFPDGNKIPLSLVQQSGTVWKMSNVNNFAQCTVCLSIYSFSLPFLVSLLLVRFKKRLMIVKRVIRSRKSEKNKRHHGQNKKEEKTNNDPQNTREATWTPLKNGNEI